MDGGFHDYWEKGNPPAWLNATSRRTGQTYRTYKAFEAGLDNPQGGDLEFWQDVADYDYVLKNMKSKKRDINDKFDSKSKHPGGAEITTVAFGSAFAVIVSAPKAQASRNHGYLFAKDPEINRQWQIRRTFDL
jgi:hypothetical protein